MKLLNIVTVCLLFLLQQPVLAAESAGGGSLFDDLGMGGAQDEVLPVDEAFQFSSEATRDALIARWQIVEGHYLYRDKVSITVDDPDVETGPLMLPPGKTKQDPIFNKVLTIFPDDTEVVLPYQYTGSGGKTVTFKVRYLGCSEISGICYPPQSQQIVVKLPVMGEARAAGPTSGQPDLAGSATTITADDADDTMVSEQDRFAQTLRSGDAWVIILGFFGAGLLLAFTPCVFPMIPILSSIIVGQGDSLTTRKAFWLSLVYVLAMALTYTVVGVLVGLSGENIQAWFQNPWIISVFVAIFVLLSLSMFGFYELQMPAGIQSKLTELSNSQQGGTVIGVAIMGFLSALIVGPCVTAPLVGALIVIAETGDAVLGGMALFALSLGMGAPLLAIGTSAGKILPGAGPWMDAVKAVFGVLLLALGIWLLERVAPPVLTMALWAALLIITSIYMGAIDTLPAGVSGWRRLWKGMGLLLLVYGVVLIIGLATGNRNVYQPLQGLTLSAGSSAEAPASHLAFRQIKGIEGLDVALQEAGARNQPVMLDFYADWCVSCKEMEALTFSDPAVQQALKGVMLLQADVTPNDEQDRALYKHFGIIGPPSIMFFDSQGNERRNYRVVGFMPPEPFSTHVERALR